MGDRSYHGPQELNADRSLRFTPLLPTLVADGNNATRKALAGILGRLGTEVVEAESMAQATELVKSRKFGLHVVESSFSDGNGLDLVREIQRHATHPVIVVQSSVGSPETIIPIMRLGVFDYLIKPIDESTWQNVLSRALEFLSMRLREEERSVDRASQLRGQLEWLAYKDVRRQLGTQHKEITVQHLREIFSSGGGIGASVSLIDMLKETGKVADESVAVDAEIFGLLLDNNRGTRAILQGLSVIEKVATQGIQAESIALGELLSELPPLLEPAIEFGKESRGITTNVNFPFHSKRETKVDREHLNLAIEELVVNAMKYARLDSTVDVFCVAGRGNWVVGIKNEVSDARSEGVGKERHLLFEPFYRARPQPEGTGSVEKFGLGLGLAYINQIALLHQGEVSLIDVLDHTGTPVRPGVLAELRIPFSE